MSYKKRLVEERIKHSLDIIGAIYIRGAKACGKTETALRYAKSSINLQHDGRNKLLAHVAPEDVLEGASPRLIDEWQEVPTIWNDVKVAVDSRKSPGQFILTGSATLEDSVKLHSGAGRFIRLDMSTMTWRELGYSNGSVSLTDLLDGKPVKARQNSVELRRILERLVVGGWPALIGYSEGDAIDVNRAYVDLMLSDDISRISGVARDRDKAERVFASLARNIATPVEVSTIATDAISDTFVGSELTVSRQATYGYLDDFSRLMLLVNQPAWSGHIRSSASLRKTPKRHLVDTSLACASLSLSSERLYQDLNFAGFLFESLVFHDLSVYAGLNDARLSYYRDSAGKEVDIIVTRRDGAWAAFEVKLGDVDLGQASEKLIAFAENIDTVRTPAPSSLNIVTGTGVAYTREDGVNILPLSVLGV